MFQKHFTLEEARGLLPQLKKIFGEIKAIRAGLETAEGDINQFIEKTSGNGGSGHSPAFLQASTRIRSLLSEVAALGVQIKDINRGLVDFPVIIDGEEVLLCWEYGEEDIGFWHDLESGYAGRQPL